MFKRKKKKKKETKRKGFLQVIFLIKSNYLICVFASKPINFIRTFALLATAEYCFSLIALCIAFSNVHTNFAVLNSIGFKEFHCLINGLLVLGK